MLRAHAANAITIARFSAALVLILIATHPVVAFWLLVAALSSDVVDGQLARRFGTVTRLGQDLDLLADSLLVASAVISLTLVGWFTLTDSFVLVGVTALMTAALLSPWLRKYPTAWRATFAFAILYAVVTCWATRAYGWHPYYYILAAILVTALMIAGYRHRICSWLHPESA